MLYEQISKDWIESRKNRDIVKSNILGVLLGIIQNKQKSFNPERLLTDAEIVAETKKLRSSSEETAKLLSTNPKNPINRETALIGWEQAYEMNALDVYIPKQMSEEQIRDIVTELKSAGGDMKSIMAEFKSKYAGLYDGKLVSDIVKNS